MHDNTIRMSRPPMYGVTTLGPGCRTGIWFQGCGHACPGCMSPDTWDPIAGEDWSIEALADAIVDAPGTTDGLTVSGGEPFDQPLQLEALLRAVRERTGDAYDILAYTGYRIGAVRRRAPGVLPLLDALIDGRFKQELVEPQMPWRGSANQLLHRLTPLADKRYGDADSPRRHPAPQAAVQVGPNGSVRVTITGVFRPGDQEGFQQALGEHDLGTDTEGEDR